MSSTIFTKLFINLKSGVLAFALPSYFITEKKKQKKKKKKDGINFSGMG